MALRLNNANPIATSWLVSLLWLFAKKIPQPFQLFSDNRSEDIGINEVVCHVSN